ncbi:MAG: hypothetical protein K8T26_14665 [Lentisphaerae bacterium]|nr:hypothetical protein [Lentisphaerota bacterium]
MTRPGRTATFAVLLLTTLLWAAFTWPLPRYWRTGIPSSAHNVEQGHVREMIPGDHLQLLYHFWLAGDMLAGKTPLFHNLYEFNDGDDAARREVGPYYAPFSLVYALGERLAGRAFGWNLTGLVAVLLSALCTFRLARRHVPGSWIALVSTLVAIALPYRWVALLGGSPSGFAMLWVPVIALGLDMAIRDKRASGGVLAGLGVVMAACTDTHTLYFGVLSMPAWCLLAYVGSEARAERGVVALRRMAMALLPAVLLAAGTLLLQSRSHGAFESSTAQGGRTVREVLLYALPMHDLLRWGVNVSGSAIYFGWGMLILLCVGALLQLRLALLETSRRHVQRTLLLGLLGAGILALAILAAGPRGILDGKLFSLCREFLPGYTMIRQPAKIFILLPTLLALGTAVSLEFLAERLRARWLGHALVTLVGGLLVLEYRVQITPTVCVLRNEQGAYAAVAADAAARGVAARALVVTLWPGDSHFASVYQHYASLYRVRLLNGYRPILPRDYVTNIFHRFESVNLGLLTDEQGAALRARGVDYVILHEDLFPEKCSPYPIGFTLDGLRRHPQLKALGRDGPVWAFRLLPAPADAPEPVRPAPDFPICSARHWRLRPGDPLRAGPTATVEAPHQRWLVQARGDGMLDGVTEVGGQPAGRGAVAVRSPHWSWFALPLPALEHQQKVAWDAQISSGTVEVQRVMLAAGDWTPPAAGDSRSWPASSFFHAGYSDPDRGTVTFDPARDPRAIVWYGPKLPLEAGVYDLDLHYASDAPPGKLLGRLNIRWRGDEEGNSVDVIAGQPVRLRFVQPGTDPFFAAFLYRREAALTLERLDLQRIR